ncbi:MAG: hypothetical protein NTV24_04815 [Candidatus Woesebacteria bacterium]|nr:hypothetical protein [Candidatus Woesebacteria bacterium]
MVIFTAEIKTVRLTPKWSRKQTWKIYTWIILNRLNQLPELWTRLEKGFYFAIKKWRMD